jgi:hypothetical protein
MAASPDSMAQWFSPDIALPFGRLQHHPVVTSRPRIDVGGFTGPGLEEPEDGEGRAGADSFAAAGSPI